MLSTLSHSDAHSPPVNGQNLAVDVSFVAGSSTPSSSAESSLTPSPTTPTSTGDQSTPRSRNNALNGPPGILSVRSRSISLPLSQRSSISSVDVASPVESTTSLNVKFAPLPELAPRKRKSTTPLGIAARSQMMRRRRQTTDPNAPSAGTPMWTNSEVESHQRRQQGFSGDINEDAEDPFVTLGKMVKVAWRKMAQKDQPKDRTKANDNAADTSLDEKAASAKSPSNPVTSEKRAALVTIVPPNESVDNAGNDREEGRVWENSIGQESPPREIGQTETIRNDDDSNVRESYPWEPSGSPRAI